MKKTFLLLTFLFFCFFSLSAQWSLDASLGINRHYNSYTNLTEGYETGLNGGYFFGLRPTYQLNENWNLGMDIQYSQKGGKFITPIFPINTSFRYSYLDFIPSTEYRLFSFLSVGLGFNVGIKLDEEFKTGVNDWASIAGGDTIKPLDFGLMGKLKFNWRNVFLAISYNHGLANINDLTYTDANGDEIDNVKQFNRNIQVGLGYAIHLKN